MFRKFALLVAAVALTACENGQRELQQPLEPMGNFRLGYAEVVAPNLVKGPISRDATQEEWIASVDAALEERFRRYQGDHYFHLGVSVEGYVLAQPGVPLVFSPKSALIVRVTVWDDRTQSKLNAETHQVTVLESFSAETMVGSGLTQSKEQQMRNLSANVALQIETWMRKMNREQGWFGGEDGTAAPTASAAPAAPANGVSVPGPILQEVTAQTR
ncbi:MAG: hypothetical protein KDK26_08760 [Roseivivax sp.]|nr:hypothetical protein [Roseivivax sp.]